MKLEVALRLQGDAEKVPSSKHYCSAAHRSTVACTAVQT